MRTITVVACLIALVTSAVAQQSAGPRPDPLGWMQAQWERVQREGRPAAERALRSAPAQFRRLRETVPALTKRVQAKVAAMNLDERRAMLLELWRVRGSLNLMALADPTLLESLTGIDAKTLRQLQAQAAKAQAQLQRK